MASWSKRLGWSKGFTAATTKDSSCCCLYAHATLTLLTQAVRAESTEDYLDSKATLTQTILLRW